MVRKNLKNSAALDRFKPASRALISSWLNADLCGSAAWIRTAIHGFKHAASLLAPSYVIGGILCGYRMLYGATRFVAAKMGERSRVSASPLPTRSRTLEAMPGQQTNSAAWEKRNMMEYALGTSRKCMFEMAASVAGTILKFFARHAHTT